MDIYYQKLAKINFIPENDIYNRLTDIYCLILSGNPEKFMYDLYHNNRPLSVRSFLSEKIQNNIR